MVSLGMASKNRNALKNKIIRKFIMPIIGQLFKLLDNKYIYKSKQITTGYYVQSKNKRKG